MSIVLCALRQFELPKSLRREVKCSARLPPNGSIASDRRYLRGSGGFSTDTRIFTSHIPGDHILLLRIYA